MRTICALLLSTSLMYTSVKIDPNEKIPLFGGLIGANFQMMSLSGEQRKDPVYELSLIGESITAYFMLYLGLNGLRRTFIGQDFKEYISKTKGVMKEKPDKVLYLTSIHDGDRLINFLDYYEGKYQEEGIDYLRVNIESIDEMKMKLSELERNGEVFDRVEIFMHAKDSKLLLSNGDVLDKAELSKLSSENQFQIADKDAELRFLSCSIASGTITSNSRDFEYLESFGKMLLPKGGSVYGATRNLIVSHNPLAHIQKNFDSPKETIIGQTFMHVIGLGNFTMIWHDMMFSLNRNYRRSVKDYVKVDINPKEE